MNSLTGTVAAPAEALLTKAGEWLLAVQIELASAPKRKPLIAVAVKPYGSYVSSAMVCKRTASLLKRGMRATVYYSTANLRNQRLELGGVDRIAADIPTYFRPAA